ncbi:MAG TPA: GNAT family N-acetyltransferase [Acidimicrobiia bacterium]|nr:GNAT family N-acetyltransferase [Acidimicrobiia bacterium]
MTRNAAIDQPIDVILRDGRTLRLRAPTAADREGLIDFYRTLSRQSLYYRFHGLPKVDQRLVDPVLESDWTNTGALLGSAAELGEDRIVALANYVRLRDPRRAEFAVSVADSHQGRGIGTRLLEQLAGRAAGEGIEYFIGEVMAENREMIQVFEGIGFEVSRVASGGEVEMIFPIATTSRYSSQVESRDHGAVVASLQPFFEARTVAVIGASARRGTIGGELFRNILEGEFAGAVYPVNRDGSPLAGVRGYASMAAIPETVDLAVVAVPAKSVIQSVESVLQTGVRAICVISAGFAEVGSEGEQRQQELLGLIRAYGARLLGPNCLGITSASTQLNATFAARSAPPGNIGFSSQSGALGLALLEAAHSRGLGLSAFVSIGNKADISSNDLLEWWEDDPATDVILLYLESFGNPRRFASIARRVARRKPILAVKSGSTGAGARAASSHTAALAGSEAAVNALFQQAGVIRTESLEELIDVASLLSAQPLPLGRRVAVMTNAGGLGILCADACDAAGLELPPLGEATLETLRSLLPPEASLGNPIDMLGSATEASYRSVLPHALADPAVDSVIVLFVPAVSASADAVASAIADSAQSQAKPVLAVVMSAEGIPHALRSDRSAAAAFTYPESAARALGRAAERADWLRRPLGSVPSLANIDRSVAQAVVDEALRDRDECWLEAPVARKLLLAYGLPLVPERQVSSADEAVAAARELGFPVAIKTGAAGVHKTELGGVALDLGSDEVVRSAAERIGGPLVVQTMVKGGVELLAGLVQDPVFGPLVAFGPGGVFAELIGEASFKIAPLTDIDAEELISGGKAGVLVRGYRGATAADPAALLDLVHRLARLGLDLPAIAELDLNPILAMPSGCVAVDYRVRLSRPVARPLTKTW